VDTRAVIKPATRQFFKSYVKDYRITPFLFSCITPRKINDFEENFSHYISENADSMHQKLCLFLNYYLLTGM